MIAQNSIGQEIYRRQYKLKISITRIKLLMRVSLIAISRGFNNNIRTKDFPIILFDEIMLFY